jgi:hypothetical protein
MGFGIVIINQVIEGSVSVTSPPAAIWLLKSGTTYPRVLSTFPKRTHEKAVILFPLK